MGFFSKLFRKEQAVEKLSKRELTEELSNLIALRFPETTVTVINASSPSDISINIQKTDGTGEPLTFYPDNLYYAYLQDTTSFEDYQENIIQNIGELLNPTDETPLLLPAIKNTSWLDACKQTDANKQDDPVVYLPLAGDLVVVFALDMSVRMSYLYQSQLVEYSPDNDLNTLYMHALNNFNSYLEHIDIQRTEIGYIIRLDGNYDASLILKVDQWLTNLSLIGQPVVAIIARNLLVIADSNDHEQVHLLRQYAKQQMDEAPYALSAELYTLKDAKLTLYDLQ